MKTYEVWYTKANGEFMQAWQGMSYEQAWLKCLDMSKRGYAACVKTAGTGKYA